MSPPKVMYPTIIKGVVYGSLLRLEALDGTETTILIDGRMDLDNFGPRQLISKAFGLGREA